MENQTDKRMDHDDTEADQGISFLCFAWASGFEVDDLWGKDEKRLENRAAETFMRERRPDS